MFFVLEAPPDHGILSFCLYPLLISSLPVWDVAEPNSCGSPSAKLLTGCSLFSLKAKKFPDPNFFPLPARYAIGRAVVNDVT